MLKSDSSEDVIRHELESQIDGLEKLATAINNLDYQLKDKTCYWDSEDNILWAEILSKKNNDSLFNICIQASFVEEMSEAKIRTELKRQIKANEKALKN